MSVPLFEVCVDVSKRVCGHVCVDVCMDVYVCRLVYESVFMGVCKDTYMWV